MAIQIKANIRNIAGKGAVRAIRKDNKVPAVIYGEKKAPVAIELDARSWGMLIKKPGLRTKLFEIDTGANKEDALLIDIQYHPVSDAPIHVDFKRIDAKKPVNVVVPIELINVDTSRGMKTGGALNFAVRKVSIIGKIDIIPDKIIVNIQELGIGDVIHGSDLSLPAGIELGLHQADLAFVTITGKEAEEAKPAAEAAAPAAAGKASAATGKTAAPAAAGKAAAPAAAAKPAAKSAKK